MKTLRLLAILSATLFGAAPLVSAQTTTLRSFRDATIRGGSYASKNYGYSTVLETKASSNSTYLRRAVLQFDTANQYSSSAQISSAQLVLTVKGGAAEARTLRACAVPVSFREPDVTWNKRNGTDYWSIPGGDIVADCSQAAVSAVPGSRVTFNVTLQVQKAIQGSYGSRYARFRIEDAGGSSAGSYKTYYSNNTSTTSLQPALVISTGTSTPTTEPTPAPTPTANERLCDSSFQDCRSPLLNLIRTEPHRIDVSFWFMKDGRYANELIKRWNEGVSIRIMMDSRAYGGTEKQLVDQMAAAGIPIRTKTTGGIIHRKFMLFDGLNKLEFSGANYSSYAFVPVDPYKNYEDESIYFTGDSAVVDSFRTIMDDMWTSGAYVNFANVGALARAYPTYAIDPELNFAPQQNYRTRILDACSAETQQIDVLMYRISDRAYSDTLINLYTQRHIAVRVYSDMSEYRDPTQPWVSWNLDRLWRAGIPVKVPAHQNINHEKLVILRGQHLTVFGSSNWSGPSAAYQDEHNYFTMKDWFFDWFSAQFDRKWNNTNPLGVQESKWFVPQPPPAPVYRSIANGASGVSWSSQRLAWDGGLYAHIYDVYFGTDSTAKTLFAHNLTLGNGVHSVALPNLSPNTRYYWRIVSKTMAMKSKSGPIWSFTTGAQ